MTNSAKHSAADELRPNLNTVCLFEDEGRRYRMYITVGGQLACERFEHDTKAWSHMPLRQANEQEIGEMLSVRYSTPDEEIARHVASYER